MNSMSAFQPLKYLLFLIVVSIMISCSSEGDHDNMTPEVPLITRKITIDPSTVHQRIVGFGGCNTVFRGANNYPRRSDMQKAFGLGDNELGLSIFRVSVPVDSARWAAVAEVAGYAQEQGAIVFASPWDAPSYMLDPAHDEKRILPEFYDEYVDHLNAFDAYMSRNGVDLHAISMQNEPDIGEWTQWTVSEVEDFMINHAGRINNTVITAESFNFSMEYYTGLLQDSAALANFEIVGGHIYGNGLGPIPLAEEQNKEIWMTEYLLNLDADSGWSNIGETRKWAESIDMLETIHESMESNWNAYVWWYLKRYYSFIGEGEQGTAEGAILKRGYAYSHYSKYIRPDYHRIDVGGDGSNNLKVTAYEGDGRIVVVILNDRSISTTAEISVAGAGSIGSVESYITSLNKNREAGAATIEGAAVLQTIDPSSVTTVVIEL